jgi:NAD+ kinase
MEAFILNPVCPFTLSNRPLVVPAHETVELEVESAQRAEVMLTVDGGGPIELRSGDKVVYKRFPKRSLIIRSDKRNFYEVLRSKLSWAGEPNPAGR